MSSGTFTVSPITPSKFPTEHWLVDLSPIGKPSWTPTTQTLPRMTLIATSTPKTSGLIRYQAASFLKYMPPGMDHVSLFSLDGSAS
jgi:hypothetical protein